MYLLLECSGLEPGAVAGAAAMRPNTGAEKPTSASVLKKNSALEAFGWDVEHYKGSSFPIQSQDDIKGPRPMTCCVALKTPEAAHVSIPVCICLSFSPATANVQWWKMFVKFAKQWKKDHVITSPFEHH